MSDGISWAREQQEEEEPVKVEVWAAVKPNGDINGTGVIKSTLVVAYPKCRIIKLREVTDEV